MPDQDGYPTDEELERIKTWGAPAGLQTAKPGPVLVGHIASVTALAVDDPGMQFCALMEYVRTIWWMPKWGFGTAEELTDEMFDRMVRRYSISTGGWSGNERIIDAMQSNLIFWGVCWLQSRRGGHYIFEIPELFW